MRWEDDFPPKWVRTARNREDWKALEEAFVGNPDNLQNKEAIQKNEKRVCKQRLIRLGYS